MRKYLTGILGALAICAIVTADEPEFRNDVPDTHTVVKGDTLWDISSTFLRNPWLWPEIWHVNSQIENPHLIYPGDVIRLIYIDGKQRLTLDNSGRIMKLEPKAHVISEGDAIDTIPLDKINNFLSRSRIVGLEELELAPYVVTGRSEHLITGKGDSVYVRGQLDEPRSAYGIYRRGDIYKDPVTKEFLGVQALDIASGTVQSKDIDVATVLVTRTKEEVRTGDRLLKHEERTIDSNFFPSAPSADIDGVVLAVEGGLSQAGKLDVVVLNRGSREGLEAGNVVSVHKRGNRIKDRISGDWVQLPDERSGLVMIFRTFEKLSLGLVLEADRGLSVNDKIKNP